MATAYHATVRTGEARFFFILSCVMAATIVAGFSLNIAMGRSSFGAPWVVHVHAVVMMGWLALFLAQTWGIFSGNRALHRRLGWLSLVWVPAILLSGLMVTRYTMQGSGGPFFFDQNQFLISNPAMLLLFAVLTLSAVAVRTDTGWHRRLMLGGLAILTGPGFGRLLPMPLMVPYSWWFAIFLPLIFPLIGALVDHRRYGRVHPAWWVAIGSVVAVQVLCDLFAYSAWGVGFTQWFLEGTNGAARPMQGGPAPF